MIENTFERYLSNSEPYFEVVREAGDVPWFEDPEKLDRLERRCPGIAERPGVEARRELFMRRYQRPQPPQGLYTDPRPKRSEGYTETNSAAIQGRAA